MESPPLISRKRHYFYVLVFSVAAWLFVAELIAGFFPLSYKNNGLLSQPGHFEYYHYANISFLVNGLVGIVAGIVFAFPIHRWLIVAHSKPENRFVPITNLASFGRSVLGWRGIVFIAFTVGIYLLGNSISHRYYIIHPSLNTPGPRGTTGFHYAIARGNFAVVRNALRAGIDIELKGNFGDTPLFYALGDSSMNSASMTRLLIEHGADVNAKNNGNQTPLHYAARYSFIDAAKILIDNGADVNAMNYHGWTPLHRAVWSASKWEKVVLLLINKGANLNIIDWKGETPLDLITKGRGSPFRENSEEEAKKIIIFLHTHGAKTAEEWRKEAERKK